MPSRAAVIIRESGWSSTPRRFGSSNTRQGAPAFAGHDGFVLLCSPWSRVARLTSPPRSGCRTSSAARSARSRRPDCPWRRRAGVSDTRRFQRRAGGGLLAVMLWRARSSAPTLPDGAAVCLASITFGFEGGVLAVASAAPPMPTLRARLENHPSFWAAGAALATRVGAAAGAGAGAAASFGGSGAPISRLSEGALGRIDVGGNGAGSARHQRQA